MSMGQELGRGAEGAVFEVPIPDAVAKIYHKVPDHKKQQKLSFMAQTADERLLSYVSWPKETLHQGSKTGPVVGFLMPKVARKDEVHLVYSPAHRRQDYPKAAWDFLLAVARNVAASFETIHSQGYVIGDVNQKGVMVGKDSKVTLIDSDSFQVNANGTLHRCLVGVPHFTPPELQGIAGFDSITRTNNHDNFGLALLIFHLLFGARHPYSGVALKQGVGDVLETDIKSFRYAYARDAQARGIAPPPRSIPLSILPDAVEAMFHAAFTERGAAGGRPTAQQWVAALDAVRTRVKKCGVSSMHVYPDHLAKCPWCALEQQGVTYFIDLGATYTQTPTGFELTRVWALIQAVPAPPPLVVPNVGTANLSPRPLPQDVTSSGMTAFYYVLVIIAALTVLTFSNFFTALVVGGIGWMVAGNIGREARIAEKQRRQAAMDAAKRDYEQIVERLEAEAGPEGFRAKRGHLEPLRDEYAKLPEATRLELDKLHATAKERQLTRYLSTCFIDNASISGVGPAKKASLRSFGIETAAEVSASAVYQVRGFGDVLTRAVLDWRNSCERRFVFNPATAVSPADKNAVLAKFGAQRMALETALAAGAMELQQFRQRATGQLAALMPLLQDAARKRAQAEKDLTVL